MTEVRAWIKDVGFPIAIAVWLILYVTPLIVRTAEGMTQHLADAAVHISLLRAICRNTAKTELQGNFCEYGRPESPP